MIDKILAENVKKRRERVGMTQKQLSKASKLSLSAISRIEQGSRWPSPENIERIASALGVQSPTLFSALPDFKITPREALAVLAEHLNKK